jgi:hypothetical protein
MEHMFWIPTTTVHLILYCCVVKQFNKEKHASGKTADLVSAVEICKFLVEQEEGWGVWVRCQLQDESKEWIRNSQEIFYSEIRKDILLPSWKSEPTNTTFCSAVYTKYVQSLACVYPFWASNRDYWRFKCQIVQEKCRWTAHLQNVPRFNMTSIFSNGTRRYVKKTEAQVLCLKSCY